ncbi:unnamed protein product [Notodromas monacha]|uniref:GPR180/TMEM145 transmembrane domain-containing protein n=1 Tax=Notodromas monacha TaxID=399045 RepID=A0A7R9GDJ8_9CRUS|nr:unnamed protein product [Notodromas monacha]CAG0917041.1 unnamed protein product [Notodromas monacha]
MELVRLDMVGADDADSDAIQSWPDAVTAVIRCLMAFLFMRELRSAFSRPERPTLSHFPTEKQRETLLRFGAAALVWFLGVPFAVIVISTKVDVFWRFKIALGLTYGVDAVGHACMCHLLWAKRHAERYGFNGSEIVTSSPTPFFLSDDGFKASKGAVGDGFKRVWDDSDVAEQSRRSLLDGDESDGVEILDITAMANLLNLGDLYLRELKEENAALKKTIDEEESALEDLLRVFKEKCYEREKALLIANSEVARRMEEDAERRLGSLSEKCVQLSSEVTTLTARKWKLERTVEEMQECTQAEITMTKKLVEEKRKLVELSKPLEEGIETLKNMLEMNARACEDYCLLEASMVELLKKSDLK